MKKNLSILNLFKGYEGVADNTYSKDALKYGIIISDNAPVDVISAAIKLYGKDGEKWNRTFHKSWETVANTPIEELVAQQVLHYFTTYGFERLGIYDKDLVYIPAEKLDVPELDVNIEMTVIHAYTKEEITEKIMTLLTSGIALSSKTLDDLKILSDYVDRERFDDIKNKEFRLYLYDRYNVVPKNPDMFLRYLIYKVSGNTLKINNDSMLNSISWGDKEVIGILLNKYLKTEDDWKKLAGIYLRNKSFFVALKSATSDKEVKHTINKLRKLAKKYHRPLDVDFLDRLSDPSYEMCKRSYLLAALDEIPVYREMRIVNGLRFMLSDCDSIVYRIRNGRSFTKDKKKLSSQDRQILEDRLSTVYNHLIERVKKNVKDRYFYLPDNFKLTAPTSEKSFIGMIPNGSSVEIPYDSNLVFGIFWKNFDLERVDLDLHLYGEVGTYGWNSNYRSSGKDVLFSGDMTDAAKGGAVELYYVDKSISENFSIMLNNYTSNDRNVPFEFVIARADKLDLNKFDKKYNDTNVNYVLDPNNIICKFNLEMNPEQIEMRLGTIRVDGKKMDVILDTVGTSNNIVSTNNKLAKARLDYYTTYAKLQLTINELLSDAGAILRENAEPVVIETVDETTGEVLKNTVEVIDLSVDKLTKDSIIKIFE